MSFFSEERPAELRELFFESAQELLQSLNEQGLELEKTRGEPEVLRSIRRSVHTLKGDSAACGFRELSELAHELEEVLQPELAISAGSALAELILSAADMFDALLAAYRGNMQPPKADPLRAMIARLLKNPITQAARTELVPTFQWSEYDRLAMEGAVANGQQVFSLALAIDRNCPMRAAALELILRVLSECGLVLARHPEEIPADAVVETLEVAIATKLDHNAIRAKCSIPTIVEKIVVLPWTPSVSAQETSASDHDVLGITEASHAIAARVSDELDEVLVETATRDHEGASKKSRVEFSGAAENTLRVDAERIDAVMNLVGELIIGKSM